MLYYIWYICLYFLLFHPCVEVWIYCSFERCTSWHLFLQSLQSHSFILHPAQCGWLCSGFIGFVLRTKKVRAGILDIINLHQFTASVHINMASFLSKTYINTEQLGILRIRWRVCVIHYIAHVNARCLIPFPNCFLF